MVNRIVWVVWVAGVLAVASGCAGAAFTGDLDPASETPDAVSQDGDGGAGSSSSSSSASSGSSSRTDDPDAGGAGDSDSGKADGPTGPCDGGGLYLHHVGLKGLTWQDCVPTGTYDAAQAIAACTAYSAAVSGGACELLTNPALTPCAFSAALEGQASLVEWTYEGSGDSTVTGRVAVGITDVNGDDGGLVTVCTSADDPAWD